MEHGAQGTGLRAQGSGLRAWSSSLIPNVPSLAWSMELRAQSKGQRHCRSAQCLRENPRNSRFKKKPCRNENVQKVICAKSKALTTSTKPLAKIPIIRGIKKDCF